jgi:hypothetical protein
LPEAVFVLAEGMPAGELPLHFQFGGCRVFISLDFESDAVFAARHTGATNGPRPMTDIEEVPIFRDLFARSDKFGRR